MTFAGRLAVVVLTSFAVANLAVSAIVPWLVDRIRAVEPALRADALRRIRLLPVALALAAGGWMALSFVIFEPRIDQESMGRVLIGSALAGALILGWSGARAVWLLGTSWRTLRRVLASATPIAIDGVSTPTVVVSSDFPIVAVVGFARQRLVIARSVLDACPSDELRAIIAHETSHIRRRDNISRVLMAVAPDVLGWLPASRHIADAWHEAVEDAADDNAEAIGPAGRLLLAEALLRIARLAPRGTAPIVLPSSALYRGEDLGRRIHRLLAPRQAVVARAPALPRQIAVTLFIAASLLALHAIHELVEAAVAFFP